MAHYRKQDAKAWAREHLRNQWTTLTTPFTPDDELDEAGLRHNIRHIQALGTAGAGCSWNMGEFWSLTREERRRLLEIVADESRERWHIAAQVTHTSYKEAIALAHHAEALDYDLLILAPPYMVTKTEKAVIEFTKAVAEATNLGIMFYNSPQFGIVMSPQGLQELCRIPNVVGVKEASFNREISLETHKLVGKDAVISTPDEWIYWAAREQGFEPQQAMFANTSDWRFDQPGRNYYVQFINKASQGELDETLYNTHLKAIKDLSDRWWADTVNKAGGVLPVAMCKYWGELMGLASGGPRLPILDLSAEDKAQLKQELEAVRAPAVAAGR